MTPDNPVDPETPKPHDFGDGPHVAEAIDWFIRLQAANGDPVTARAFRAWLDSDPERAAAFGKVNDLWGSPEFMLATKNVAKATGFTPPSKPRRRSVAKKTTLIATAVIVALSVAQLPDLTLRMRSDYVTETGEQQVVALPDGSSMTMNTGTAVALNFTQGQRTVRILKGEAYFDVRAVPDSRFQVTGQFGQVEVKGTAFSVRLNDADDSVVLSRGVVDVARMAQPADRAALAPGQTVSVTAAAMTPITQIDPEQSLAWVSGRISFSDQPFGQVLNELRRYYPGRIFVARGAIERTAVSGSYRLDKPLLAIQALADSAGASVTVLPGGIVILR